MGTPRGVGLRRFFLPFPPLLRLHLDDNAFLDTSLRHRRLPHRLIGPQTIFSTFQLILVIILSFLFLLHVFTKNGIPPSSSFTLRRCFNSFPSPPLLPLLTDATSLLLSSFLFVSRSVLLSSESETHSFLFMSAVPYAFSSRCVFWRGKRSRRRRGKRKCLFTTTNRR